MVPAARSPSDRFSAWCSTPAGQGVLQQLRWLAPTQPILVARLQAELGTVPASSQALWVSISQFRRVPIRTGTSLSWGFHLSWDDAKALLHTRCTCDLAPWSYPSPLSLPHLRESANCGQTGPCVCISCRRTIHFRPHCGRWNCGAHQAYAPPQTTPSASAQTVPTPGCTLQLPLQSVCSAPLLRESHNIAQQTGLSCRRIKRWLLRYPQRHSGPIPVSTIRIASIVYLLLPVLLTSTQSSPQSSATCVGKELFSAPLRTILMKPPLN